MYGSNLSIVKGQDGLQESTKDSFTRMHKEMHDDDYIAEHMREENVRQIKKDKITDTGL